MTACSACGAANPDAAKFCSECGTPLQRSCPTCGAVVGPVQRFCGECGSALQASVAAAAALGAPSVPGHGVTQAERRVCSVLFVDLVGFTPFTEARDAEDVRELLSRYFERARTVVERYGGVVEKFIGDAVMAIWGTPVAKEGDAERAVRAGLEVLAAVAELGAAVGAPELRARAGVVTGDVAVTVGAIGEGVAGDTVNTAARVQGVAIPGAVWVDDVTERLTHAAIGYVDAGDHQLKGKAEPLHLWAATRVLSMIGGIQRVDGLEAPLLGRDVEWRTIKELFHTSVERRAARLVVVSGPAGVGKSRLGWEFEKYIDGLADEVFWHRGRCLSYGEGVAFWALAAAVRQRLGIGEEDAADVAGEKLAAGLDGFVPDPLEREYVGIRLGRLLGVPFAADSWSGMPREELFAGWRLFFERLAEQSPVVLLFEDGHHADSGLLDFVDHLVDWSRGAPIYVLVFARPELADLAPGWGVGRNRTTITLETLDDTAMDTLVDTLVPGMPASTRAAVANQAQGIPLYAVETIRSLIDRDVVVPRDGVYRLVGDVSDLAVPDTLRGLLAARFDALPPELHTLLADAAVLGTSFPADALVAVSGRDPDTVRRALDELVRREILDVSADPLSPQRGFYGFSQNLLRQVVYDTLSRRDRKARHVAVAAHLRSTFAGDGDEVIDVIAQHYVDAVAAAPDDDDVDRLREQAVAALERAAERSERSGAPQRAAESLATAADLAIDGPGGATRAAELLEGAALLAIAAAGLTTARDLAGRAVELYTARGDTRAAARSRVTLGWVAALAADFETARAELTGALAELQDPRDGETVRALLELSRAHSFDGHPEASIAAAGEAIDLAQALGVDTAMMARVFASQGIAYQFANRHEEAVAAMRHALRLADKAQDSGTLSNVRGNLADALLTVDTEEAFALALQTRNESRRAGLRLPLVVAVCNCVNSLLWLGRWDEAEQLLVEADADGLGDDSIVLQSRAMALALRGELDTLAGLRGLPGVDVVDIQDAMYAAVIDALAARAAGQDRDVITGVLAALPRARSLGTRNETFVWLWTAASRAALELADAQALDGLLAELAREPDGHLAPLLRAQRQLVLAKRSGRAADFVAAVAALRAVGSPYHLAHGLLDLAEARQRPTTPGRPRWPRTRPPR